MSEIEVLKTVYKIIGKFLADEENRNEISINNSGDDNQQNINIMNSECSAGKSVDIGKP